MLAGYMLVMWPVALLLNNLHVYGVIVAITTTFIALWIIISIDQKAADRKHRHHPHFEGRHREDSYYQS